MSAGRRGLMLSVAFFGLAAWLCPSQRAHAQRFQRGQPFQPPPMWHMEPLTGQHKLWNEPLSIDQVKKLLGNYGKGDKEADNLLEKLIRDAVQQKNPNANTDQINAAIKRMLADKEFMNRVMDLAQKQKNQFPDNQIKLSPEDIAKLRNAVPNGTNRDPFQVPDKAPPKFDLKTIPLDLKTGRPFDPPPQPKVQPPVVPPKVEQPPPLLDPKIAPPPEPPAADTKPLFDPMNPLGTPKETPESMAKTKAAEAATALWEKNVGPIEESPDVKRAIFDLINDPEAMDALTDGTGKTIFDMLKDLDLNSGDSGLGDIFGGEGFGSGWEWPKLDMSWARTDRNWNFGDSPDRSRSRWPEGGSSRWGRSGITSFDGMGSFDFGGMQVPWMLALIILVIIVGAVLWWKWNVIFASNSSLALAGGALGAWPIDPREINTREDVVKAFEYLSVLICGPQAKTWTHSTIADELMALVSTHGETAVKLARLYELARYAPLDEPLTRAELLEARRLVCDLAGMDEA